MSDATLLQPLRALELEVLESIYAHRLLTTHQLHRLHTPAGQTRGRQWIHATCSRLRRRRLIAAVRRQGHSRLHCWYATGAGADAVEAAAPGLLGRRVLPTPEGAAGMLQSHTLAVNDVGIAFASWAKRLGHECGHLGWTNEVAHRTGDRRSGSGDLLVADALLHYAANLAGRVTLVYRFVELDRATMSTHAVGDKLRRYVAYGRDAPKDRDGREAWRDRYPALPGVLLVLAGKPRQALLARRQMITGLCHLDPVIRDAAGPAIAITLLEDLQRHGPFAGIFQRPADPDRPVDLLGRATAAPDAPAIPATGTEGAS
jgi:hypothetical protein